MSDVPPPNSVSIDADDWIAGFPEKLEQEFLQIAKWTFSPNSDIRDYQRALIYAFRRLLADTGMPEAEMHSTFCDPKFGWTESKNARRFELIDREVANILSFEEALELESLTFQLRYANRAIEEDRVLQARQELDLLKSQLERNRSKSS